MPIACVWSLSKEEVERGTSEATRRRRWHRRRRAKGLSAMPSPYVRLLGAVRFVTTAGEVVDLPSPAQRRVLAALAVASGATQRTEYLGDALGLSTGSLRTTVSRLRSTIGDDV